MGRPVQDSDLVFDAPDGSPIRLDSIITQAFTVIAQSVGFPKMHLHSLRHYHASLLLQQGVPVKVISERLGHSSTASTMDT